MSNKAKLGIFIIILFVILLGASFLGLIPRMDKDPNQNTEGNITSNSEFAEFNGTIEEVLTDNDNEVVSIEVKNSNSKEADLIFNIFEDTYITDTNYSTREDKKGYLEKGTNVTVYYDLKSPMALSYPGQVAGKVIVVNQPNSDIFYLFDKFDKDLVDSNNLVQIIPLKDDKTDYKNKNLLIFYAGSTKSIPAQTTPEYIEVID